MADKSWELHESAQSWLGSAQPDSVRLPWLPAGVLGAPHDGTELAQSDGMQLPTGAPGAWGTISHCAWPSLCLHVGSQHSSG